MSLANKYGFKPNAFAALANDDLFTGRNTITVRLGKKVSYNATIHGHKVKAFVTLLEPAKLSRVSIANNVQVSTNKPYKIVEGIFKPAKMAISIVDDGQEIAIQDFLFAVAQEVTPGISREQFDENSRKMGMNWDDGMPLFWMQFGANAAAYENLAQVMLNNGGKKTTVANNKRIESVYVHDTGLDVVQFEVGTVDRSASPRGQGFLDFVDAIVTQYERCAGMRAEANILLDATKNLTQEQIKANHQRALELQNMASQWSSSWGGAQVRMVNDGVGGFVEENQYDPTKVPCGRFTLNVGGELTAVDLWTNKSKANTSEVTTDSKPNVTHAFDAN